MHIKRVSADGVFDIISSGRKPFQKSWFVGGSFGDGKEARWDFLQYPVTMFSRRFKDLLDAYEPDLFFQEVVLIHKENSLQYRYVHTLMDQLDAVGSRTEYYPNGTVKRLVLDREKIGRHNLFLLKGNHRKDPIVSLPLAESLLRRKPVGICFEEVEVQ